MQGCQAACAGCGRRRGSDSGSDDMLGMGGGRGGRHQRQWWPAWPEVAVAMVAARIWRARRAGSTRTGQLPVSPYGAACALPQELSSQWCHRELKPHFGFFWELNSHFIFFCYKSPSVPFSKKLAGPDRGWSRFSIVFARERPGRLLITNTRVCARSSVLGGGKPSEIRPKVRLRRTGTYA